MALALGLLLLAVVGNSGGQTTTPDLLLLDPIGTFDHPTFSTSPPGDESVSSSFSKAASSSSCRPARPGTFMTVPNVFYDGSERGLLSGLPARLRDERPLLRLLHASPDGNIQVDEFHRDASNPGPRRPQHAPGSDHGAPPEPGEPQRRPARVRPRRDALHGNGGRRGRRRSVPDGPEPPGPARKDPAHRPASDGEEPYRCRPNNPFVGQAPWKPEIWAYGVRNPWRFSFDRVTGDFSLGDVGQNTWEEIDYQPISAGWGRGVNFGWSCMEARHLRRELPSRRTTRCRSTSTTTTSEAARSRAGTWAMTRRFRACWAVTSTRTTAGADLVERARDPGRARRPFRTGSRTPRRSARTRAATCTSWARAAGRPNVYRIRQRTRRGSSACRSTTCPS